MKDTKKDGKKIDEIMGGILQRGDAGYQDERQKILEGLAEHGSPEMQNMVDR